jgi:BolA protein
MSGSVAQEMEAKLREEFSPTRLEIVNDSAKHAGHSGDDGSGESHFTIVIEAPAFADMNRLARQRAVIAALGDIVGERVHAVAIQASAPTA